MNVSDAINRNVVVGRYFPLKTDTAQRVCEHNISFSKEDGQSYMTLSTQKGDGIGNASYLDRSRPLDATADFLNETRSVG